MTFSSSLSTLHISFDVTCYSPLSIFKGFELTALCSQNRFPFPIFVVSKPFGRELQFCSVIIIIQSCVLSSASTNS